MEQALPTCFNLNSGCCISEIGQEKSLTSESVFDATVMVLETGKVTKIIHSRASA